MINEKEGLLLGLFAVLLFFKMLSLSVELVNLKVRLIVLNFLSIMLDSPCITELLILQDTASLGENDTAWMVTIGEEVKVISADLFDHLKLFNCVQF